ncbi:MAG: ATP-dependent DNA helicase RecG [Pirellulaceae bacterium]
MPGTQNKHHAHSIEDLQGPVQFLKGVGPQRAELLEKLELHTVADVLFFFPRNYQNFSHLEEISDLQEETAASVVGHVVDIQQWTTASGTNVFAVLLERNGLHMRGIWFNQNYLQKKFASGQLVMLQGTPKFDEGRWEMVHARTTWFGPDEEPHQGSIVPVYPLTGGLNQRKIREVITHAVEEFGHLVPEVLPESFRAEKNLCQIHDAIHQIHTPDDEQSLQQARTRFVYQELFVLQAALAMRRARLRRDQNAPPLPLDGKIHARILRRFPFELSAPQSRAIGEIARDLSGMIPMNRLLHGEVGSGKTVVAAFAMLLAVAHGKQAVMMAPTELLARQHVRTLEQWLQNGRVHIAAWTGSQTDSQRQTLAADVKTGRVHILVGTHALLSSPPEFADLGLVIIDEQHKFGVRQRARLRQAGANPHYLVMTATPIPRTISMTAFGDLDVSTLEKPAARQHPTHTYLGTDESREQWWEFVRKKLREGRQAYVVAPLVQGDDESRISSAEQLLESLVNGPLEEFRVDILHGRQKAAEKDSVMLGFQRGLTQVLVATSVVEVGIDVPNATVMTIESAERFGLSQLHQLRGRVSRGDHPGYVCVFPSTHSEPAFERLQAFVESEDGFELAEKDFELRGPGNLFSSQQHGMPPLRIADLLRDGELLQRARNDAKALIDQDPTLSAEEYGGIRKMIIARYGPSLEISDVG